MSLNNIETKNEMDLFERFSQPSNAYENCEGEERK